jgi:transcriptional antiterminator NusG
MLYWYVLFVGTGREKAIERKINIALGSVLLVPIIPLCEEKFIKKGIAKFQKRPVFPGYVFIESSLESMVFREHIKVLL